MPGEGSAGCWLCAAAPAPLPCPTCGLPACSPAHAALHRGPTTGCHALRVGQREGVGQVALAARDLVPGDLVLTDRPAVWGPSLKGVPACVECLAPWSGPALCPACGYPRCQEGECRAAPGQAEHGAECGLLARLAPPPQFLPGRPEPALGLVLIARFLRLGPRDPAAAARVAVLMDHLEEVAAGELGNMWRCTAVAALVHRLPDSPYTEADVLHAVGTLQTNTVSVGVPGVNQGLGLFPTFSLLSHSCIANCRYQVVGDGGLVLRAQTAVARDEELTIHYITPMLGTADRRARIRKNWFFDCCCPRCSDPTELGTFLSGQVCPGCRGVLLPARPLEPACPWTCSACPHSLPAEGAADMVARAGRELEGAGEGPGPLQDLLLAWTTTLHPQHYLALQAKRRLLASLHRASAGQPPVRGLLQQMVDLADESLRVFGPLAPGPGLLRGRMLQYRNGPKLQLAKLDLEEGKIGKEEFLAETKAAIRNVKLATKCFEHSG